MEFLQEWMYMILLFREQSVDFGRSCTRGCLFCSAGGSGDFACIGFSGIYIGNNWKCDGADRISRGIGSAYDCENVFVLCRNGIIAWYLQGIWNGFEKRNDRFNFDGVYGNDFLYDVCVFYVSKGEKNQVYSCRSTYCNICRACSECVAGSTCINKSCI